MKHIYLVATVLLLCGPSCEARLAPEGRAIKQKIDKVLEHGPISVEQWNDLVKQVRFYIRNEYEKIAPKSFSAASVYTGVSSFSFDDALRKLQRLESLGTQVLQTVSKMKNLQRRRMLYGDVLENLQSEVVQIVEFGGELERELTEMQETICPLYARKCDVLKILLELSNQLYNVSFEVVPAESV